MRAFFSLCCSREDDCLKGSAPGSCSQRADESVFLSVLFSFGESHRRRCRSWRLLAKRALETVLYFVLFAHHALAARAIV